MLTGNPFQRWNKEPCILTPTPKCGSKPPPPNFFVEIPDNSYFPNVGDLVGFRFVCLKW